jgi:formylglycine-generating enzyme
MKNADFEFSPAHTRHGHGIWAVRRLLLGLSFNGPKRKNSQQFGSSPNLGNQTVIFMKTNLRSLFIVLALLAGIHPATAQVTNLGIAPAGNQSLLYWPVGSNNYVLQTVTNLTSTNWVTATNTVADNAVTVTNSAPAGYFRLLQSTNPTGMVLIPAGSFTMGNYLANNFYNTATNDPDIVDANPTNVYVSAFYMDVNLVSSNQWAAVHSYATGHGYTFTHAGSAKAGNNPVQTVEWYDCVAWCNARSVQAGLTPCYYTDAGLTQVYTNATGTNVYLNMANQGYRLPTEAEWEKAARGGLTGNRFPWGDIIAESLANYFAEPASYSYDLGPYSGFNTNFDSGSVFTSPVGSFAPNGYGLYDISGNVSEWCWDWYAAPPYPAGSPYLGGANPTGAATGSDRMLRGGRGDGDASYARCAFRSFTGPNATFDYDGFRCVMGL